MLTINEKPEGAVLDAYEIILHTELYNHIVNIVKSHPDLVDKTNSDALLYGGEIPDKKIIVVCRLVSAFHMMISISTSVEENDWYCLEWHGASSNGACRFEQFDDMFDHIDSIVLPWYAAFESGQYDKCTEIIKNDGGETYVVRG